MKPLKFGTLSTREGCTVSEPADANLLKTPLFDLHVELGGKMVPFAGYAMPVQYPPGILAEHRHTRESASLFDVSHMGQVSLLGQGADQALEALVPGDIQGLAMGRIRYTMFTNAQGGILDDLMVTRDEGRIALVVNAACKEQDIAHLKTHLEPKGIQVQFHPERALLALQGPKASAVMARLSPGAEAMPFMSARKLDIQGIACFASRSGYTGEDGYEISVPNEKAVELAKALLAQPEVKPCGLGARDSLRLEAGLCLYGSDIDAATTPIEANLLWTIGKRRREEGGFAGDAVILKQIKEGAKRLRVGIRPDDKAPARAHTDIIDAKGNKVGEVTSGGFGPSTGHPVAMGYVETPSAKPGTAVGLVVRGTARPAKIVALPFVAHRYFKN
jgi:aminomethyltransferase